MSRGLFVAGTGTNIGKTVVTALLVKMLKNASLDVVPMKAVQTGGRLSANDLLIAPDLDFVIRETDLQVNASELELMAPYVYRPVCSPHLAAEISGDEIDIRKITKSADELLSRHDFLIVEGAGGVMVPLNQSEVMLDLIKALNFPVVIVASTELGTLNHTFLTLEALRNRGIVIRGLVLNDLEPMRADDIVPDGNVSTLARFSGTEILFRVPFMEELFSRPFEAITTAVTSIKREPSVCKFLSECILSGDMSSEPTLSLADIALREMDNKYLWHPYTDIATYESQMDYTVITNTDGVFLCDSAGRKHYDGISSWWCVNLGHGHPKIVRALQQKVSSIQQTILGGLVHPDAAHLAKEIVEILPSGLNHVLFASDGSSAVEAALQIAIQYWWNCDVEGKSKFVCLKNAYHGDTIGTISVGYVDRFHGPFKNILLPTFQAQAPHCCQCPFGKTPDLCGMECFESMAEILRTHKNEIAAVIIEPLCQAAGGMNIYPPAYLTRLRLLCDEYDLLLIADEIAVGFGRTGKMFACEHAQISPDIMVIGKGLTGGYLPMSATIVTDRIYDSFRNTAELSSQRDHTFFHGHTFCGNPLTAICALAALNVFREENIIQSLPPKIAILEEAFSRLNEMLPASRHQTLGMIGMLEISALDGGAKRAREVALCSRQNGLFIRPLGNVVYLFPPLISSEEELRAMIKILSQAMIK